MAYIEEVAESDAIREAEGGEGSFLSEILKPGSSLNATFLAILDGAFVSLLLILIGLLFLTSGSIHIFVLIFIEMCLWASVKWCVTHYMNLYKSFVHNIIHIGS
jgi:hypothetical protein